MTLLTDLESMCLDDMCLEIYLALFYNHMSERYYYYIDRYGFCKAFEKWSREYFQQLLSDSELMSVEEFYNKHPINTCCDIWLHMIDEFLTEHNLTIFEYDYRKLQDVLYMQFAHVVDYMSIFDNESMYNAVRKYGYDELYELLIDHFKQSHKHRSFRLGSMLQSRVYPKEALMYMSNTSFNTLPLPVLAAVTKDLGKIDLREIVRFQH